MAQVLAQNAIALLIDLAERGEIDPWDVKVIDVVDQFLAQLRPGLHNRVGQAAYDADLLESGQAFLYASMLVLLKADSLARDTEAEQQDEMEVLGTTDEVELAVGLPTNLERQLRRRAVAHPPQQRRVTLPELIQQLELISATIANQRPRGRSRRTQPRSKSAAVKAISQLAHHENLADIAVALEQILAIHWPEVGDGVDWLDFEQLLEFWATPSVQAKLEAVDIATDRSHSDQGDRVGVFWGLLFLSAQSKVELSQQHFYQDLKVRSLSRHSLQSLENQTGTSSD
ncbi:MAG: segregation/condensation protein A [Cyanothece sp. SIO2G6]|nr:segregation/condensation protein A [Cyanothece sp. SIO2G6]